MVECAEYHVLICSEEYLKTYHPPFVLATYNCNVKGVTENCKTFLDNLHYKMTKIDDDKNFRQEDSFCIHS